MPQNTEPVLPADQWQGPKVRLITGLSHYDFLEKFGPPTPQYARPVAYIRTASGEGGTGFLVAPDLLLTNQHVLHTAAEAATCRVWFNYNQGLSVEQDPAVDLYTCTTTGPNDFYASPAPDMQNGHPVDAQHLDFALVRIEIPTPPGTKYGYLPIAGYTPTFDKKAQMTIIQHPQHRRTEVGQGVDQLQFRSALILQYVTDTEPGASGSPIFNSANANAWQILGLHHAGVQLPPGFAAPYGNEGIMITAILAELQAHAPVLLTEVKQAATNLKLPVGAPAPGTIPPSGH